MKNIFLGNLEESAHFLTLVFPIILGSASSSKLNKVAEEFAVSKQPHVFVVQYAAQIGSPQLTSEEA